MARPSKLWGPYSHPDRNAPYVRNDASIIYGQPVVKVEDRHKAVLQKIAELETLQPNDVLISVLSPDTSYRFQSYRENGRHRAIYKVYDGSQIELREDQPIVEEACKEQYRGQIVLTQDQLLKRLPPGYQAPQQRRPSRPSLSTQSTSASIKAKSKAGLRVAAYEEKLGQSQAPPSPRRHRFSPRKAADRFIAAVGRPRTHSRRPTRQRMHPITMESLS